MAGLAVAIALVATGVLLVQNYAWLPAALGDTDDATRIVMVRELLAGRGWWDQHWMRLQPPVGVYMHWSAQASTPGRRRSRPGSSGRGSA